MENQNEQGTRERLVAQLHAQTFNYSFYNFTKYRLSTEQVKLIEKVEIALLDYSSTKKTETEFMKEGVKIVDKCETINK